VFEINYAKAISDPMQYRKNFIAKAFDLINALNSKNVIIGCGSDMQILQRNPHDTISLGTMIGLSKANALLAITKNCENWVKRGKWRKSFKGVVDLACDGEIENNLEYKEKIGSGKSLLDQEFGQDKDMEE
jgi:RNase P/RNase MRP subunit p30